MIGNRVDVSGKTAIVTGGGGDLGAAIAYEWLESGGRVLLVDASSDSLDSMAEALGQGSDQVQIHVADVRAEDSVASYVAHALEWAGAVDALFNNAGVEGSFTPISEYSTVEFQRVLDVNLMGVFLGLKHVLPTMTARGSGAIVNSASVSGLGGAINLSAYVASKHAVVGLTRTAAMEAAPFGVRVNAICPSAVEGRMISSIGSMTLAATGIAPSFEQRNPTGRLATAKEIARVATFLASDHASFVNGAAWVIDGGRTA